MDLHPHHALSPAHTPFTVASLLAEPSLRGSCLLAGSPAGLDRAVSWCLPWPEISTGVEPAAGVAVHARVSDLADADATAVRAALRRLAPRGVTALLLSGDGRRLPSELLAAAGPELPVVQLPAAASFAVANRIVAERALATAAHVLEYSVTVHRALADLLHRGAGVPALGRQLAALSQSPAFILDPQGKVLVYEYLGANSVPDPYEVIRLLREAGVLARADQEPTATPQVELVEIAMEDERVACLVAPIVLGRKHLGTLVLVELAPRPNEHDLARHRVIIEQAATIAGSELLRLRSVEEAMERARGDFVHALLHGRFANPHDLIARAAHHDFDIDACYGVVAAHGFNLLGSAHSLTAMLALARRAEQVLRRAGVQTLATVVEDVLVVIRQVVPGPTGRADATGGSGQVGEYAAALARELERHVGRAIAVTYGWPASGARGISSSYREARIALGVCERLGTARVAGYAELRVFAALADIASSPQGRSFAEDVLAPLHQDSAGGDLERTVIAYLESGGNLNAAARRLALHRNTMLYKLDRASRLLGMDLREPDNRFTLWLAHRINLLGEVQAGVDGEFRPAG